MVGIFVGSNVVGALDGVLVGSKVVGLPVGAFVGTLVVGDVDGILVGFNVVGEGVSGQKKLQNSYMMSLMTYFSSNKQVLEAFLDNLVMENIHLLYNNILHNLHSHISFLDILDLDIYNFL